MRVAALYDIHGNVPALDAVLAEVEREGVDLIVFGGDVAAGPMPAETIERMRAAGGRCVMGNADRQMVEDFDAGRDPAGADGELQRAMWWAAARIDRAQRDYLAGFEPTVTAHRAAIWRSSRPRPGRTASARSSRASRSA